MQRRPELDIIRAIAVIVTIYHHAGLVTANLPAWMLFLVNGTWIGVDMFFVLSGFFVAGLLFREYREQGKVKLLHFLGRRGFKIYPAFYFFIFLNLIILLYSVANWSSFWPRIWHELFYIQNYLPGLFAHTWSLAVEEHFYLLLAALIFILIRFQRKLANIPWIALAVGFACLAMRVYLSQFPFDLYTDRYPTHLRIDALMAGVAIAYYYQFNRSAFTTFANRYKYPLLVGGIALLLLPFYYKNFGVLMNTVGYMTNYLGAGMLVISATALRAPRWLSPLAYIGVQSYSIYLWHVPIVMFGYPIAASFFPEMGPYWVPVYMLASVIFGILMAVLIERPFLLLRDRILPARAKGASI